ncbi:MAG TPA: SIMPL domain-containing protein [Spirochaetales bacterium]|nr:SIMPL domain-containing protein [Spirochaetales bacterium]
MNRFVNRRFFKLILFAVLGAFVALAPLSAQSLTPYERTIRVSGTYQTTVIADMAVLTLSVTKQAATPLMVQKAVTNSADKIVKALLSLGIERKDIATSAFSLSAIYNDQEGKQNEIVGYRSTSTITTTLYDTSKVSLVVQTGMEAGATEIESLNYQKKDAQAMEIEMYQKAVLNAMDKAAAMAQTLGATLGKAVTVEEQSFSSRGQNEPVYLMKAMAGPSAPEEAFAPGSLQVSASVRIVFELE